MSEMVEYKIVICVKVPNEATQKQVKEWAEFSTGYTGFLKEGNPIYNERGSDIEAISCRVTKP